jgi:NTP pyrophosphatase (non-canonical NTP hydrolase)
MSNVFKDALKYWGFKAQIEQTQEECAELIVVLNKFFNRKLSHISLNDVASEIADVEIMCQQMRIIVGDDKVDEYRVAKQINLERELDGKVS